MASKSLRGHRLKYLLSQSSSELSSTGDMDTQERIQQRATTMQGLLKSRWGNWGCSVWRRHCWHCSAWRRLRRALINIYKYTAGPAQWFNRSRWSSGCRIWQYQAWTSPSLTASLSQLLCSEFHPLAGTCFPSNFFLSKNGISSWGFSFNKPAFFS